VFTQVALSEHFACSLRDDGQILCWGDLDGDDLDAQPDGTYVSVAVHRHGACGVLDGAEGSVVCGPHAAPLQVETATDHAARSAVGILVEDSQDVVVEDNEVSDLVGGQGPRQAEGGDGGEGGHTHGIALYAVTGARVQGNHVHDITGGDAGAGSPDAVDGGSAKGLKVHGCTGIELRGNHVHDLAGGLRDGQPSGYPAGVQVEGSDVTSENDLVHDVEGYDPLGFNTFSAEGVDPALSVDRATVAALGASRAAVCVRTSGETTGSVTNSILTGCAHSGVWGHGASLRVEYCLFSGAGTPVREAVAGEGIVEADPQLVTRDGDAYALGDDSPAIDAGDPEAACVREPYTPDPGGGCGTCRVDLGHLGNTEHGQACAVPGCGR